MPYATSASTAALAIAADRAAVRAEAVISFGLDVKRVRTVNLMEEGPGKPLEIKDNGVTLSLRPFEIATLLIET